MADDSVEKIHYASPKYTDVVLQGERRTSSRFENLQSKGWRAEGKLRFMNLFEEIETYRETKVEEVQRMLANYLAIEEGNGNQENKEVM